MDLLSDAQDIADTNATTWQREKREEAHRQTERARKILDNRLRATMGDGAGAIVATMVRTWTNDLISTKEVNHVFLLSLPGHTGVVRAEVLVVSGRSGYSDLTLRRSRRFLPTKAITPVEAARILSA